MDTKPILHPNGFIQYDLPGQSRLHIWAPDLPAAQKVYTPIHNHTFDFKSEILLGELHHDVYDFIWDDKPQNSWQLYVASEDGILRPLSIWGRVLMDHPHVYYPGQKYSFKAGLFHESRGVGELTATIMTKTRVSNRRELPAVVIPEGTAPDNTFRRDQYPAEFLMDWVNRVMKETNVLSRT